ncbi:MAG: hypothetical protein JSW00_05485 [Thermoplasmata archaeon]|nr:MAG: hypothetical protein JSW00_05485 [Thermoplasmata archaeon]
MKKKIIGIFVCTLLIATALSAATSYDTTELPPPYLIVGQVDFLFTEEIQKDSHWGYLRVKVKEFLQQHQAEEGYLNMFTDAGWVVQNQFLNIVENQDELSMFFNLGVKPGQDVRLLSFHYELSAEPVRYFQDGPRTESNVVAIPYNAGGLSDMSLAIPDYIMELEFIPAGINYDYTKENLYANENVQAAMNQCGPMAVANSLQYLENRYAFFSVPHDHVIGLYGDDSLVGQLDEYMGRVAATRTSGGGVMADELLEGKFQYLADNGLTNKLIHKHQGTGYNNPVGDFTHAGITSKDESVGGKVTFDWIEEQLRKCQDVEVGIQWGSGGGHAVRIYGCGKTLGVPYLRYKHDSLQTNYDPTDSLGLEEAQVYVSDLDGDGSPNWGSASNEIVCAWSESVQHLVIQIDPKIFHLYVFIKVINRGVYDIEELPWEIHADGLVLFGQSTKGYENIPAGDEVTIQTGLMLGLGPVELSIMAGGAMATAKCTLLGPFVIGVKESNG